MTEHELHTAYFDWLCKLVTDERAQSYDNLLHQLHATDFEYIIPMDSNRSADGMDLRYRFGREQGIDDRKIASYLDYKTCSVLEMMVALSVRCEEQIMWDPDDVERPGRWFWGMITNLGLYEMTDTYYSARTVADIIDRFMFRKYEPDGRGGLFTVDDTNQDMRSIEIWYQMNLYLDEIV